MSSYQRSRRSFLRALSGAMVGLPFMGLLQRSALGAPPNAPLRFMSIIHPHGRALEFWRPLTGFDISHQNMSLQPFDDAATYGKSFKDKLIVIEGLDNLPTVGHYHEPALLTGSRLHLTNGSNSNPECESIDQYLAVTNKLGNETAFSTINFSRDLRVVFGKGGVEVNTFSSPLTLYQTVFANFVAPDTDATATLARGKSSLDYVTASLTRLNGRLAAPEKAVLDQHLTAIREIEQRLSTLATASCTPPQSPDPKTMPDPSTGANYDRGTLINSTVLGLIAEAFACDLTRFATVCLDPPGPAKDPAEALGSTSQDPGVNPPLEIEDVHAGVAHPYDQSYPFKSLGGVGAFNGDGNVSSMQSQLRLARLNKYFMSHAAAFTKRLDDHGILDSSLTMVASDFGNPNIHECFNLPVVLVGGANGYFPTGRYVQLPNSPLSNFNDATAFKAKSGNLVPMNRLLVSVCNAFGLNNTSYGVSNDAAVTQGALTQLKG